MEVAILVFGSYVTLVAFIGYLLARFAPLGYEDEHGFHEGAEPAPPHDAGNGWHHEAA